MATLPSLFPHFFLLDGVHARPRGTATYGTEGSFLGFTRLWFFPEAPDLLVSYPFDFFR